MSILASDGAPSDGTLSSIEAFLAETIPTLVPDDAPPRGRGRPQILPSLCLWSGMLVCVLHGFSAQLALWRLLAQQGLWWYPRLAISDQAVYTRLEREGVRPLETLFAAITAPGRKHDPP